MRSKGTDVVVSGPLAETGGGVRQAFASEIVYATPMQVQSVQLSGSTRSQGLQSLSEGAEINSLVSLTEILTTRSGCEQCTVTDLYLWPG